jgi:hypothetical protein
MKKGMFVLVVALVLTLSLTVSAQGPGDWTEHPENPIFGHGVDNGPKAYYPSVLYDTESFSGHGVSAEYKMWYGTSGGQTGLATSDDGISWTDQGVVVSNGYHATVLYDAAQFGEVGGPYYKIWYWPGIGTVNSIGAIRYAESSNGISWDNDQAITQDATHPLWDGQPGWWYHLYGPAFVIYNEGALNSGGDPFDYSYVMYFDACSEVGPGGIEALALAYSANGKYWIRYGDSPVLLPSGNPADWDGDYVTRGSVVRLSDGTYAMWYSGGKTDSNDGIGYAHSSDGLSWTKDAGNPIFHQDDAVDWRLDRSYTPWVIQVDGVYKMWFSGKDASDNYAIGYATGAPPPSEVWVDDDYCASCPNDGHTWGYDAFDSIQDGIDAVAGSTVNVAPGMYTERVVIDKPLTLLGATHTVNKNGYTVPADYAWDTSVESVINYPDPTGLEKKLSQLVDILSSDVTFKGFVVQVLNARGHFNGDNLFRVNAGIAGTGTLQNIVVENNVLGPATNVTSQDGAYGRMNLYLASPTYPTHYQGITNSRFAGNKIFGAEGNGNNVFVWGSAENYGSPQNADYTGTVIEDNEIYGSHRSGIEIAGGVSNLTIRNNTIRNNSSTNGGASDTNLKYGNGILVIRMGSDKTSPTARGADGLIIENNGIYDNEKNAIYLGPINSNYTITGNDIRDNGWDGIRVDLTEQYYGGAYPVYDKTSGIEAHFNNISENTDHGVRVVGTPTNGFVFDATCNWWGAVNGPGSFGPGSGDHVSGHVDYAPWLTAPAPGGPCNSDTPRGAKLIVVDNLQRLLPTGDKKTDHRIEEAIEHIQKSLNIDPKDGGQWKKHELWLDDTHLDSKHGKKVFDEEKKAVHELMKIDTPDVSAEINALVAADEALAQTAIDDAIDGGGDQKDIEKAYKELEKAQEELDHTKKDGTPDPHYDKAIDHYKKAWEHACKVKKPKGVEIEPFAITDELKVVAYPNPIRDVDTATFQVMGPMAAEVEEIRVQIYDLSGRLVWEDAALGSELDWHTDSGKIAVLR